MLNDVTLEKETRKIEAQTICVSRNAPGPIKEPSIPSAQVAPQRLTVHRLSSEDSHSNTFMVHGHNLASFELDIFDLAGRKIFHSGTISSNALYWDHLNDHDQQVPNGVYLYVIRARTTDGQTLRSEITKLMVFH